MSFMRENHPHSEGPLLRSKPQNSQVSSWVDENYSRNKGYCPFDRIVQLAGASSDGDTYMLTSVKIGELHPSSWSVFDALSTFSIFLKLTIMKTICLILSQVCSGLVSNLQNTGWNFPFYLFDLPFIKLFAMVPAN